MRKLLPYEHALIEALDISEEEYFAFRKAQTEYSDPKAGTVLDVRNGEPISTIALVLSIVGTVAQVAAALLAPRPETPEVGGGGRRSRDRRFAPRIGFDSLQDLAQYGDPVNLVYGDRGNGTNTGNSALANPNGGVRVNTALLWSAVYSFGNAQYIQMMAAIGAGEIVEVNHDSTALGQTLVHLFSKGTKGGLTRASAWQYFKNSGPIVKADLRAGAQQDPLLVGVSNSRTVYDPLIDATVRSQGFSQAFSPSTSKDFGITSPIPIYIDVFARDDKGKVKKANVGIVVDETSSRLTYWPNSYAASGRRSIPEGVTFNVTIKNTKDDRGDDEADNFAQEVRESVVESLELGAMYKLGSAKFQITSIAGEVELSKGSTVLTLQCVEQGMGPFEDYQTENVDEQLKELKDRAKQLKDLLDPSLPTSYVYLRSSLSEANYFYSPDWTPRQVRLLERTRVKKDQVEEIYEAAVSFKRNRGQMDELLLAAENAIPGRQFSPLVISYAQGIRGLEQLLEDARDYKERINARIEADGMTDNRRENLRNVKATIQTYKEELRKDRSKLAAALKEEGVADGLIDTQFGIANNLINGIRQDFVNELTVNGRLLPQYRLLFEQIETVLQTIGLNDGGTGRKERKTLRKLKNVFAKIENLLLQFGKVDYDAFNTEKARLDGLISSTRNELSSVENQIKNPERLNDYLGTKCLVRIQEAEYETLSPINLVHFALKAKVFMRIQGRASKYAETDEPNYSDADNGYKPRTAMFRAYYKRPSDSIWQSPNVIFCARKTYDKDTYIPLIFRSPDSIGQAKWQFRFEPVHDAPSEALKAGKALQFVYLEARGSTKSLDGIFFYKGHTRSPGVNNVPRKNKAPYGVDEWMIFSPHADTAIQYSFDNGTELSITAVTEQQFANIQAIPNLYKNIATIGFNAYSGAGLTSMRNLSVFVNKGKKVRCIQVAPASIPSSPNGPSCFAPDIFVDTILDDENGIRTFVGDITEKNLDIEKLALSKSFCMKQRYFMDGVIADQGSWREFWAEVAPYSLLEFARIGGKETLIPSVPTTGDGTITRNISISALFNQGNILADSYKEEFIDYGESTQDLIATVIYRDQSNDEPFPRNTSVTVRLKDAVESLCSRRSFDLSSFVTNANQAADYGKLLVQQRRHIRRAVEFKTFPTEAPVQPGSYIYVHMEENQWNNIHSGAVLDDGTLNIPFANEVINGSYDTLIYVPGNAPIKQTISYTNGQAAALSNYKGKGALFVLGSQISGKRVFRVTEVSLGEEGEVTIKATEHPCVEESGQTKSLIVRFDASLYEIA